MRAANLALRFVLELCALAALSYWGFHTGSSEAGRWFLGIGAPLVAAVVWGLFIAPRRRFGVPTAAWVGLQIVVFGAALAALFAADEPTLAIVFGALVVVNAALMIVWHQRGDPSDVVP